MNRYLLVFGLVCCSLISCLKEKKLYDSNIQEKIKNCTLTEILDVPAKEGYTTVVTCGEDTLAVANRPISIIIPKQVSTLTRSVTDNTVKIDYALLKTTETYSKCWQAVMFEDTENGDYDYNDLILHVRNTCNYPWRKEYSEQTIEIQPIALGSENTIKLGCLLGPESEEIILSENVRQDLFKGVTGYINTLNDQAPIRYKLEPTVVHHYRIATAQLIPTIAWFIEVNGKRHYAISSDVDYRVYSMFNWEGMPYGLVSTANNGIFGYPQEKTPIFQVYPDFKDWYNGKKETFESQRDKSLIYKYCYGNIKGEDGKTHKIWDYQDL